MLVVVLLLPIVIMIVACLLERFEAHAVVGTPARRARRPLAVEASSPALTLVPGDDVDDEDDAATDIPAAPAALRAAS